MKRNILFLLMIAASGLAGGFSASATPHLEKLATLNCGRQPKQVLFSYDNKYLVLPLLDDTGFQVIAKDGSANIKIQPPNASKVGFAEGLFIPEKKSFFVSQMTTANIYEYSYDDKAPVEKAFTYKRTINTNGNWSKFIAYSKEKNLLAVSNWVSNDVSLIDYDTGKVLRLLKTGKAPRGLKFIEGGSQIIAVCFDGGQIQKFTTDTGKMTDQIFIQNAAMRHIVVNSDETQAFVSDMMHFCVYRIDLKTFKKTDTWKVYYNPNTIDLLQDRYVVVSCRGPNNPTDYTKRSPVNGRIIVIDTTDGTVVQTVTGGNQPTGLDVSPDESTLAFTNFQDANVELWNIK